MFRIGDLAKDDRVLTCVTYRIFQERDLVATFQIPRRNLLNFLTSLEDLYLRDVPYHNHFHAADVTQSTHVLLNSANLEVKKARSKLKLHLIVVRSRSLCSRRWRYSPRSLPLLSTTSTTPESPTSTS